MNIKTFLILIFLCVNLTFSQKNYPSKKELSQIFKKSIKQDKRNKISVGNNNWISSNKDSLYYKSDTLKIFNYSFKEKKHEFCQTVNWTFYRKNAFISNESEHCDEPPTSKITSNKDYYTIKIVEKDSLFIELYNFKKIIEIFKLTDLTKNGEKIVLTFVRQKYDRNRT